MPLQIKLSKTKPIFRTLFLNKKIKTKNMSDNKPKSFWSKPEGKPGMVLMGGAILAGGFFLYKALPSVIELMNNLYTALALGAGLLFIGGLVTNGKVRATAGYMFRGFCRTLTGIAIELNPIAILEGYIEDLNKKVRKMEEQISGLKSQMSVTDKKIQERKGQVETSMSRMQKLASQHAGDMPIKAEQMKAARTQEYVNKLTVLLAKLEVLYKVLSKMKEYSKIVIEDTVSRVEIAKDEREAITKGYNAMRAAMDVINGDGDKKELFDQSMEFMVNDTASMVGQMERMLEESTSFIDGIDLDNAIFEDKGLAMFEEFERRGAEAIFGKKNLNVGNSYENLNSFTPNQYSQQSMPAPTSNSSEPGKKKYF